LTTPALLQGRGVWDGQHPGVTFWAKSTLKTHIKTVHEKRNDHACQYCPGVVFGEKSHLNTHIKVVHLKLREHACPYCPSVAYQTNAQILHTGW
jgi:hypothetical protein